MADTLRVEVLAMAEAAGWPRVYLSATWAIGPGRDVRTATVAVLNADQLTQALRSASRQVGPDETERVH